MSTSPISLTSNLLTQMAESPWWTAARVEAQTDSSLGELLKNTRNRPAFTYHLHNSISTVARLAASMAIYTVVSPVGMLYHTGQALDPRNCADLSIRHLKCAGSELLRTALSASLVGIPILITNGVLTHSLFIDLGIATAAVMTTMETAYSIANPFLNSRRLDAADDRDRIAQAILRWDIGFVGESKNLDSNGNYTDILLKIINENDCTMLAKISALQLLLPEEHRLPLPLDGRLNIERILDYLEECREKLSQEDWEAIKPVRERLIHHSRIRDKLQRHTRETGIPFGLQKEEIKNAFTGNNTLILPSRIAPALRIHSLTQTLFVKMWSSNWLYPSNYESQERDDKGSIVVSMREFDALANRKKIEDPINTYVKKPFRWIARGICGTVICATGASVGTLMHGAQALYYLGASMLLGADARFKNMQYAQAHGHAAWNDFSGLCVLWSRARWMYGFSRTPEEAVQNIASREDRAGLSLALILKNHFGVTGPHGALLSYNPDDAAIMSLVEGAAFLHCFRM